MKERNAEHLRYDPAMSLVHHFQQMARYNTLANGRLYEVCARLDVSEYRKEREASFRSIERTLNHILVGDRIWLGRFQGADPRLPLNAILYEDFNSLWQARKDEDARLEQYVAQLTDEALLSPLHYRNSAGEPFEDPLHFLLTHLFNHQTHHRGQVHVMLTQAGLQPPSLDLHRLLRPKPMSANR